MGDNACTDLKTRIPELPSIMRRHGWGVGAMLMEHWLYTPANDNPEHGIHDVANYVRMDWVLSFGLALEVYQRAVDQKVWVNKAGKNRIIDHLIHNKGRLPKVVGEKLEIGNVGECQHIHSGNVLQFHKDWQVQFREVKQSLVRPMLDDLYGALGDFNFHFLVNGWVERLADKNGQAHYEVTITKVGVYIKDSYDFNDDPNSLLSQPLGFWGCNPLYIGTRPGLNRYYVNNADFREWRKKDGRGFGGDFMVFSEIKVLSTNDSFSFP